MKSFLLVVAISLCIFSVFADEATVTLSSANFQETISNNQFVLAMFYAPWCGHCKTLKPLYEEAAAKTQGKYVLAKIDCTVESELCQQHGVRGYPTVAFFKNGNKREYDGPRTTEGIISWLDKKSGPLAVELTSAQSIQEFQQNRPAVVGYFAQKDSQAYTNFLSSAENPSTSEFRFAYVSDSTLFGDNQEGTIDFFPAGSTSEITVPVDQTESAGSIANYLFDQSFPLVAEVDASNFKNYVSRGKKLMLAWIKLKEESSPQQVALFSQIAASYPQFSFGYISFENFGANMERMGGSGKVIPAITLLSFTDNRPVVFEREGAWDEENIREWIDGVISGKYKYQLKSEPVPENNNGPVTVLVGNNFNEIVNDATKDVLVEFYAPWCGHCKNLVPEYEKLGQAFQGVNDVVIAKIDLTANDVESHHEVKGFPTILLYTREGKTTPAEYKGPRDAKSIAAWIKDNTKSETAQSVKHDEL